MWGRTVAQQVKLPSAIQASHIGVPVSVLAAQLPIQLLANAHRKAAEDDPSAWVFATYMEDPYGIPSSWLNLTQPQLLWAFGE